MYVSGKLPNYPSPNTYFSLWAKCKVWGGVGGQFPVTYIDPHLSALSSLKVIRQAPSCGADGVRVYCGDARL